MALLTTATRTIIATPSDPLAPDEVELVLVGQAGNSSSMGQRIRSLFAPDTRFSGKNSLPVLDRNAVLHPDKPGTLYLWITLGSGHAARVYVAMREREAQSTRYLFREVELKSGLDEVGSETVAQVAHSSARALWARELQSSRSVVTSAIETDPIVEHSTLTEPSAEPRTMREAVPPSSAAPRRALPPAAPRRPLPRHTPRSDADKPISFQLSLAAMYAAQASGGEGWLDEFGATANATFAEHFTARVSGAYLLPQRFDATLTTVNLSGFTGQIRVGWKTAAAAGFRGHIETGLGLMALRWRADSTAPAQAQPGTSQLRQFAVEAIGGEWSVAFLLVAARFELRVPFRETIYEVGNLPNGGSVQTRLSQGFSLELGFPLDRLF